MGNTKYKGNAGGRFYWSWVVEMESCEVGEFRENTRCNVEGRMWELGGVISGRWRRLMAASRKYSCPDSQIRNTP